MVAHPDDIAFIYARGVLKYASGKFVACNKLAYAFQSERHQNGARPLPVAHVTAYPRCSPHAHSSERWMVLQVMTAQWDLCDGALVTVTTPHLEHSDMGHCD